EDGEHLEERGALPPRAGLRDRVTAELRGDGGFVARPERREVVGGDDAGVRPAVGVPVRDRGEGARGRGDEALTPLGPDRVDPALPVTGAGGSGQPLERTAVALVADERGGPPHPPA